MKIVSLELAEINDSRGEPTIEVSLQSGGRRFAAKIPSGKSRGRNEATVLPPPLARLA